MKIRYTRKALAQLDRIYLYIEARNPSAAKRVKARIKQGNPAACSPPLQLPRQ